MLAGFPGAEIEAHTVERPPQDLSVFGFWSENPGGSGEGAGQGPGREGQAMTLTPCRFKGIKKGGVTENTSYYIFTQCPDGAFEAFPVHNWYNFTPLARHRTLTAEEAEEEWER